MPEPISKSEIDKIEASGGKVSLMAKIIAIPGLERIAEHFHQMKHEQAVAYKEAMDAKLAKMDEIIKALQNQDLAAAMQKLCEIQAGMLELKREHEKKEDHDDDDDEPCEYKLTGKRDRRGFIDIEAGLTFTPVKRDG